PGHRRRRLAAGRHRCRTRRSRHGAGVRLPRCAGDPCHRQGRADALRRQPREAGASERRRGHRGGQRRHLPFVRRSGMPIDITMPALSPTMEEGKLAKWHVKEGDTVSSGDVIAEIETDKATMEVEAVDEGKIGKILVAEGTDNVKVNAVIAVLLQEGESADDMTAAPKAEAPKAEVPKDDAAKAAPPAKTAETPEPDKAEATKTEAAPAPSPSAKAAPAPTKSPGDKVFASPLARRLAKEAGIDVAAISGTGPKGRVVKSDVEAAKSGATPLKAASPSAVGAPAAAGVAATGMSKAQVLAMYEEGSYEAVPNDGMRKVVAARLTESKQTVPH